MLRGTQRAILQGITDAFARPFDSPLATHAMADNAAVTDLLGRWKTGDRDAEHELITLVYPILREIAAAQVRRNSGVLTLQATELANEAYGKLTRLHGIEWQNRDHFFAVAATAIRHVVVDYLRERGSQKRGGRIPLLNLHELSDEQMPVIDESLDWLGLDEALIEFAELDPRCARVVELKFFSELSTERIAEACGSSVPTVVRQWRFARAWLGRRLGADAAP